MGFEARVRAAAAALVMATAVGAAVAATGSPRWQVLAGLIGLAAAAVGWRALRPGPRPAAPAAFDGEAQALTRRLALLDSQMEQLPVALWTQPLGQPVAPMNARARRLIAPGGAVDKTALLHQLARSGERALLGIEAERGQERWLLSASTLSLGGEETRLLAMLPVESALEAENLHAWRQLTHVLTHEIMNSLTPIASLSRTALGLLGELQAGDVADVADVTDDLALALDTVARRAEALASFVGNYRRVSELPAPHPEPVLLTALFARLEQLVAAEWRARGGDATFTVEPASLTLMADPGQLEQVLLNLLKNAAEATAALAGTAEVPRVNLSARLVRGGRLLLTVRDNGPGVPAGLERDIFLPFFSARAETALAPVSANAPAPASKEVRGIGLAVVRSLVHGMGGTVRCVKTLRGGASFVISF